MGSVYSRGTTLWIAYKDARGVRVCKSTGLRVGREREAERVLLEIERLVEGASEGPATPMPAAPTSALAHEPKRGPLPSASITVKQYAERWLAARRGRIRSVDDEAGRLQHHVYPHLGERSLESIRPRDIRDLILKLRENKKLAPRTIRHVFAVLSRLFRSAVVDELIVASPAIVEKGILPKNVDKDPKWRATAIFERDEVVTLISDRRIPEPRRILYAIKFLSGVRHGEAAGLYWSDYDADMAPLGRFRVSHQYVDEPLKTGVPREVPVHPVLATILKAWRESGFRTAFGRDPRPQDFIAPNRDFNTRTSDATDDDFRDDLERVGLRRRRGHDSRRTFTTIAQVDGARRDILKVITHAASADDIVGVYTSYPWPVLCEQVSCIKITLPEAEVMPLHSKPPGNDGGGEPSAEGSGAGGGSTEDAPGVAAAARTGRRPAAAEVSAGRGGQATETAAPATMPATKSRRGTPRDVAATGSATFVAHSGAAAEIPESFPVIPPGLEPGACGLGNRRSIHLSYGIEAPNLPDRAAVCKAPRGRAEARITASWRGARACPGSRGRPGSRSGRPSRRAGGRGRP
jgi:integrase